MKLEIVTHSWCYARLLTYHLSSILRHPPRDPRNRVTVTVWHSPSEDKETAGVLAFFTEQLRQSSITSLSWNWRELTHDYLVNRAIGRNASALENTADFVHMCDADYQVQEGFFDAMLAVLAAVPSAPLVYPARVLATTHEHGAELLGAMDAAFSRGGPVIAEDLPTERLIEQKFRKAIGGIQFARGDVCRRLGYCNTPRELQPFAGNWRDNKEDRKFRVSMGGTGLAVECPGLIRIRHGERGGPDKAVRF